MSKNFNNNTIVDSSLNLQVATLNTNLLTNYPTNTAISTLLASTVQSQTVLRDSAISASLSAANLFTSNSLLNYMTTSLINSLLASTITTQSNLRDTAIASALSAYTTTNAMNILLASTITSQSNLRDSAIATSLAAANAFTTSALIPYSTTLSISGQINNSLISANSFTTSALSSYTNTISLNAIINTNALNQSTVLNNNIATAINTNNTVYLANLLSTNYLTSTLTNNAITASSNSNNVFSTAYTNTKITTEITRADLALSNAITANNLLYTPSTNIGQNTQFNSTSIGQGIKALSGFSVLLGNNSAASNYGIAIGYNSGQNCNIANASCSFFGSNSSITPGSSFTNSTAIGSGAIISSSNQIMLGDVNTTAYCANITTPNLTSTIHNVNQQIVSYNTIPIFLSMKYIGFMNSALSLKNISAFNTYTNLASISIIPGVYLIQFQMNYNYSASNLLSWINYGVGTTSSNLDIQACKSYCSSSPSVPFNISNSYIYTAATSLIIYLNAFLNDFDNTTLTVANLSNISIASKLTICRIINSIQLA